MAYHRNQAGICIGLWLISAGPIAAQSTCTFPASTNVCHSPNHRWTLRWKEATESSPHILLAEQRGSDRANKLLTFDRGIDASWSPDSNHVAITNHAGSNYSEVLVAELASGAIVNVEDEMRRTLKTQQRIYANGHRYFNAVRWQSHDSLVFEVRAYDAEPGRELHATFIYSLKNHVVTQAS
jgi:hypothetical protein